jgi:hypothetical protein
MRLRRFLLAVAAVAAALPAQTTDKPLTNGEIGSMLTAGLPESTILLKIETAAYRGLVNLDVSPAALIALKQRGASEPVLNAVMWAEPFGAAWKRQQEEDRVAPGLPDSSGAYYKAPSGWVALPSSLLWPPFYSLSSLSFLRSREYDVPLGGRHADLQIAGGQPVFYLRRPASPNWQMVRVTPRDDRRFLRVVSTGDAVARNRFESSRTRPIQITRLAADVFTVRPAAPLEPGEYVLCTTVVGSADVNACYAFGIQH